MLLRLLFVSLAAADFSGLLSSPSAVFGGDPVEEGSPYARRVVMVLAEANTCSGVLIREDAVLTAAHCLGFGKSEVVFYEGSRKEIARRPVSTAYPHPAYVAGAPSGFDSDIAVLRFAGGVPSPFFRPVPLFIGEVKVGDPVEMVGLGLSSPVSKELFLLRASMRVAHVRKGGRHSYFVAADAAGAQAVCGGDSGGAAFVKRGGVLYLAGTITRTLAEKHDCSKGGPAVAIPARDFFPWIDTTLQ